MRQAVMTKAGHIDFTEVPVPEIWIEQVLLKVMRIGVCGSDIHVFHGKHPYVSFPLVQGHEVSFEVVRAGAGVKDFKPGDRVTIEPQVSCGKCFPCEQGMYNICDNLKVIGFQAMGTASDYFAADASRLVKLPSNMDFGSGAMIEPLAVAVRAVKKAGIRNGMKALVLGAGPIGNLTAQTAKAMGAAKVIIADINDFRLKKAVDCGIDCAVNTSKEDLSAVVDKTFGSREKADVIFECAGAVPLMQTAVSLARKGTHIVVVGVFGEKVPMDMALVNESELSVIGTARYVIEDFKTAIGLVEKGLVKLQPLITDEFDFLKYEDAYRHIDENRDKVMKVLIKVNA
ncbi:MAG: alcohol dehydrogenase [Spirochaetales bacterium]|nr:MAG: alcohol dehydrogenase [Spirochaetales bacterium]